MKLVIVLALIGLAFAYANGISNDGDINTRENENGTLYSSVEEKKDVVQKLILTRNDTDRNHTTTNDRSYKKPIFKIVQKAVKMKHNNYWKTATRRPSLMRNTKYNVDPITLNERIYPVDINLDKLIKRKHDINQFRKIMSTNAKDDSSEEALETLTDKNKVRVNHVKSLVRKFHKLGSKISRDNNVENISKFNERVKANTHTVSTVKPSGDDFSSEESEDRQEFIFVTKKIQQNVRVAENSDELGETTTVVLEKESRQKRSINIIEEENLGTTVSGFKFTGKIGSLNSNFAFRNINS